MERAKPKAFRRSMSSELLLRDSYRRSLGHSGGAIALGAALDNPNLLCPRPDVYIESWGYAGRR